MAIVLYESDKTTPLTGSSLSSVSAGADSGYVDGWAFNTGDTIARNVLLIQQTKHPVTPNTYLSSGLTPQDEMWGRFKITGQDNTADPTFVVTLTDYMPMGAYGGVLLGDIPAGCGIGFRYLQHPPSSADDNVGWIWSLRPVWNAYSQPIPPALGMVDRGILTGIGDPSRYGALPVIYTARDGDGANAATLLGTPDGANHVTIDAGVVLYKGRLYPRITEQFTLDQNDSAAAALTVGQLYWATFSAGAGGVVTATKGLKGASPAKAAVPTGEILLGYIRVRYDAGGGAIDNTDVDWNYPDYMDRYQPSNGGNLDLWIGPGQAVFGATWRYSASTQTVTLDDDTDNYVWQLASGLFDFTATDAPPETTAMPICKATTAGGVITAIEDRRVMAGAWQEITLRGAPPGSPGSVQSTYIGPDHLVLDSTVYAASDNGGGASGQTQLDTKQNGTTIFTDFATDDWRPTIAYNAGAADLKVTWALPQVVDFYRGDKLELLTSENPTGGNPAEVLAIYVFRKP